MATSSLTKQFVVKDMDAFQRLLKDLEEQPPRAPQNAKDLPSLEEGREALLKFLSR